MQQQQTQIESEIFEVLTDYLTDEEATYASIKLAEILTDRED
tara:strand:+ start:5023 stop:5148 length:126 start_codon:yes stop_codon:yes gene_type:complete